MSRLESPYKLSLLSRSVEERSAVIPAWPGQGVYWHQFTRPLVTRDGCDPGEAGVWCDEVMWRGNGPAPPGHSEEICTGNIYMYYWLIMKATFVKSVCCYSDGDLEMVHLRVTGECGAKELGQSCLLTRPWTLNRNIESEGEKQLEIIIQYPVWPRSGTSASKEIHNSLMILWRTDVLE